MDQSQAQPEKANAGPNLNEMATDRTRLAAERTLMAWIRTALAMISFGFTIYKFMQILQERGEANIMNIHAPRNVGLSLIGIGTLALMIACIQHFRYLVSLHPNQSYKFWVDLSFIIAALLGLLGFLMFGSIMLRSGPFE